MFNFLFVFFLFFFFDLKATFLEENTEREGYVSVVLSGQFGNQLFEIATAYAYALDHNLHLTIPDLVRQKKEGIPYNYKELFVSKIHSYDVPCQMERYWKEPNFNYNPIPNSKAIELRGYFQSEKYFSHRRAEILELFAAPEGYNKRILDKYPFLFSDALVVGVQIRDYRIEQPRGNYHPTLDRSYYEKAMSLFPEEAIFIVSSNNLQYARECTQGFRENIIYMLNSNQYIEEFYALVLCKSFIISNSSFGWWAAWLSTAPEKRVVAPRSWVSFPYHNESMIRDLFPRDWILLSN